jgi:thioredoxin 1
MKLRFVLTIIISAVISAYSADSTTVKKAVVDSSQQIADKIVQSKKSVLVDFWAAWCGPCRLLNPILKDLEKEYQGKLVFMKVNVDIHRAIASYFGINAIPMVFIIKDKTVVKVLQGLQPKEAYAGAIKEVLASSVKPAVPPKTAEEKPQPKQNETP